MTDLERLHHETVERLEYLCENCQDLDQEDKVAQLQMIFDGMRKQTDPDLLAEEIYILTYYSFEDPEAVLHVNIIFPSRGDTNV